MDDAPTIHKVAIVRNRMHEFLIRNFLRWTRCGIRISSERVSRKWSGVTCKNCLRTKA